MIILCAIGYVACEWVKYRIDDWFPNKLAVTKDTLLTTVVDTAWCQGRYDESDTYKEVTKPGKQWRDSNRITIVDSLGRITKQYMIYYK